VYAVVSRIPGGVWNRVAGPFETVQEAHDLALRMVRDTPRGEAIVATCPWRSDLDERANVNVARVKGYIERVTR
jgi:hypothetical protein